MGRIYETMCRDYLAKASSREPPAETRQGRGSPPVDSGLPFKIRQMGRWWGTNPAIKSEEEIDIIGINEKSSSAVFCECKYRNEPTDIQILNALIKKAQRWTNYNSKYYILFSKSGFTRGVIAAARKAGNVQLISLKDMYREST